MSKPKRPTTPKRTPPTLAVLGQKLLDAIVSREVARVAEYEARTGFMSKWRVADQRHETAQDRQVRALNRYLKARGVRS